MYYFSTMQFKKMRYLNLQLNKNRQYLMTINSEYLGSWLISQNGLRDCLMVWVQIILYTLSRDK